MPAKKAKPEKDQTKDPGKPPRQPEAEARPQEDIRRLLRTAAWSRMFGRTSGDKNPFTR